MNTIPIWQLLPVLAIPMLGIFLGILLNQRYSERLSGDIKDLRKELAELRQEIKSEYVGLLGMIADHSQRLVRIEERTAR